MHYGCGGLEIVALFVGIFLCGFRQRGGPLNIMTASALISSSSTSNALVIISGGGRHSAGAGSIFR